MAKRRKVKKIKVNTPGAGVVTQETPAPLINPTELSTFLNGVLNSLTEISANQKTISDLAKKEDIKKLKKDTESKEKDKKPKDDVVDDPNDEDKKDKELGKLRKAFQDSFQSMKTLFSPGGMLKNIGLLSGSPIFMLIGDKLDELSDYYKDLQEEENEIRKEELKLKKNESKDNFLKEEQRNEELRVQEKTNEILEDIRDKGNSNEEKKDDKKSLLDYLILPLTLLASKLLPNGIIKAFTSSKIFGSIGKMLGFGGKAAGGAAAGGILGGAGKLFKGGAKLLGKMALPLTLLMGGIDFAKGFSNGEEITGRKGTAAKIQGGISEAISGLTLGLIDAKTISQGIDLLVDKIKELFTEPIQFIKDVWNGKISLVDAISTVYSKLTFGLISKEDIKSVITTVVDKIKNFFMAPITLVKDLWNGKGLVDSIGDYYKNISFGLLTKDNILSVVDFFKTKFFDFITAPFHMFKDIFSGRSITDSIMDFISKITFDFVSPEMIKKGVGFVIDKIKNILYYPIKIIQDIWDHEKAPFIKMYEYVKSKAEAFLEEVNAIITVVGDTLVGIFNSIVETFNDRFNFVKESVDNLVNAMSDPFKTIMDFFGAKKVDPGNVQVVEPNAAAYVQQIDQAAAGEISTPTPDVTPVQHGPTINTPNVAPVQHESKTLTKVTDEAAKLNESEKMLRDMYKMNKKDIGNSTNLINNVNNNISPQTDMSTGNDDPGYTRKRGY